MRSAIAMPLRRTRALLLLAALCLTRLSGLAEITQLLPNGGFERVEDGQPVHWSKLTREGTAILSQESARGQHAVRLALGATGDPLTIFYHGTESNGAGGIPVVPRGTYTARALVRGEGQCAFYFNLRDGGGGYIKSVFSPSTPLVDEWRPHQYVFTVPEDLPVRKIGFGFALRSPNGNALLDEISLSYDTADNPGIPNIYATRDLHQRFDLVITTADADIVLAVNGEPVTPRGTTYSCTIPEGVATLEITATPAGPAPGVIVTCEQFPSLNTRWNANGLRPRFHTDGSMWAGTATTPARFRQHVLWNAAHTGPNRCFIPPSQVLELPALGVESLRPALYSPLAAPLEDFTLTLQLPPAIRCLTLSDLPTDNTYNIRPGRVDRDAATGEVALHYDARYLLPDKTYYTFIPLAIGTNLPDRTSISYFRTANGNFTELPTTIPVQALPPIAGKAPKRIRIQQYLTPPVKNSLLSREHLTATVAQTVAMGCNTIILNPRSRNAATAQLHDAFLDAKPDMDIFLWLNGSFPAKIQLWGQRTDYITELIAWAGAHPAAIPRYFDDTPPVPWVSGNDGVFYATLCPSYITGEGRAAYSAHLTNILTRVVARHAKVDGVFIDWEERPWKRSQMGLWCFCNRCKQAFEAHSHIPNAAHFDDLAIASDYRAEWQRFRSHLDGLHMGVIRDCCHALDLSLQVYHWESETQFWGNAHSHVDEAFATLPGNSPADGFRQPRIDDTMRRFKALGIPRIIGQRFSYFGPSAKQNGWKDFLICSTDGTFMQTQSWKSQLLRVIASVHGGIDLQNIGLFPAGSQFYMGEATRIISTYEELFLNGTRADHLASSDTLAYPNLLVLEHGRERLILAFNETREAQHARIKSSGLLPGSVATIEGENQPRPAGAIDLLVPPNDLKVIHITAPDANADKGMNP